MIDRATWQTVFDRAGNRCEYCQLASENSPLALQVEHVIPRKHGGDDSLSNLASACIACNLHKGANLTGIDPGSREITILFNPRSDLWEDHFRWMGSQIQGITDIGRTTVRVLEMNSDDRLLQRETSRGNSDGRSM